MHSHQHKKSWHDINSDAKQRACLFKDNTPLCTYTNSLFLVDMTQSFNCSKNTIPLSSKQNLSKPIHNIKVSKRCIYHKQAVMYTKLWQGCTKIAMCLKQFRLASIICLAKQQTAFSWNVQACGDSYGYICFHYKAEMIKTCHAWYQCMVTYFYARCELKKYC